jgi:vanillate O-demethylase ferredoxin subunit
MRPSLRNKLLWLHTWTGLLIGVVLVFMAVTGIGQALRPRLEKVVDAHLLKVEPCSARVPLDTLVTNAHAANPGGGALTLLRLSGAADASSHVRFSDGNWVYLNPCSGTVLGIEHRYGGLFGTIDALHRFRYVPNGSIITGTCTLAFALLLIIGGLMLWWPSTLRGVRRTLTVDARLGGRAYLLNLHKTAGFYAGIVLLFSSLTGLPHALTWVQNGLYTLTGSPLPASTPKTGAPKGAARLPIEQLWGRAQALVPDSASVLVDYPKKAREAIVFELVARDAPHPAARSYVTLDPYTGKLIDFTPYAANSAGHKLYLWVLSLHAGQVGGLFVQLLLIAAALCVPLMAYTGLIAYLRRRVRIRAPQPLSLKVARKSIEARDVCSFELVDPHGALLPPFTAGAHIDVRVREGLTRQYSLCNDPRDRHRYVIFVLRQPGSRGGSAALHDEVAEGCVLQVTPPRNNFPLVPSAGRSLLIAGGIGVTPIFCMAQALESSGADFAMHYCSRSPGQTALMDHIRNASFAHRVRFHFSTEPDNRLDLGAVLAQYGHDTHIYVCGPRSFMQAMLAVARQRGWPESQLHSEAFASEMHSAQDDRAFDVELAGSGVVVQVAPGQSVVAALAGCGVHLPTSCNEGVCGTCVVRVIEGEPEHRDGCLSPEAREQNAHFVPCVSRSRSPLLLLDL